MNKQLPAISMALFSGIMLLLWSVHDMTSDSLSYIRIARGINAENLLLHPHHLFYIPALKFLFGLFGNIHAGAIAKTFGAVSAMVCVYGMYQIFSKIFQNIASAAIWSISLLICSGFWLFAVQEVYVPSMAFLVILTWQMVEIFDKQELSNRTAIILSLLLIGAVGFHQTNVLICAPMIYVLYSLPFTNKEKLTKGMLIFGTSGVLVLAMYMISARIKMGAWGFDAFSGFCFTYHNMGVAGWGEVQNVSLPNLLKLMGKQYQNIFQIDEKVYADFGFRTLCALLLLRFWHRKQIQQNTSFAALRQFCLVWLGVYYAFFLWWLPSEREFTIVTLIPLLILLGLFTQDMFDLLQTHHTQYAKPALHVLSAALSIGILQANIPYMRDWSTHVSPSEQAAKELLSTGVPKCKMYVDDFGTFEYINYLANQFVDGRVAFIPLDYAYRGNLNGNPDNYALPRNECSWFLSGLTEPNTALYGTYNAFAQPKSWFTMMRIIFHLDLDENKQIKESSRYAFKKVGIYNVIEVQAERVKYQNTEEFMQVLDSTRSAFLKDSALFYSSFYRQYSKEIEQ